MPLDPAQAFLDMALRVEFGGICQALHTGWAWNFSQQPLILSTVLFCPGSNEFLVAVTTLVCFALQESHPKEEGHMVLPAGVDTEVLMVGLSLGWPPDHQDGHRPCAES